MSIGLALLILFFLMSLNAFFVLAEFAIVKIRPTRVEELIDRKRRGARLLQHIQTHMDEYLSVCQLGITSTSIGLGAVVEPTFAARLEPLFGSGAWAHGVASTVAVIIASFFHVVFAEQVPKMIGIYRNEQSALFSTRPLQVFRYMFYLPLVVLNGLVTLTLRLFGIKGKHRDALHSEEELKIILEHSQSRGMMSFRRLLLMENVFDLGDLKVRDAMKARSGCKTLDASAPWEENLKTLQASRFSRYPLIDTDPEKPLGVIHVKDLLYENPSDLGRVDLRKIARKYVTAKEDNSLESLLGELQRKRGHMVIVVNAQERWSGFITLEDIIEEIIGAIEDEFEMEPPLFLADTLSAARIVLDVSADSMEQAVLQIFGKVPSEDLPLPVGRIAEAILERERVLPTFLGRGIAIPHARMDGVSKPLLIFARSPDGIPIKGRKEKAHLIFILITPVTSPRVQARLLARIGGLMDSEFVEERLREASTPQAVLEAIRTGDPVAVS